MADKGQGSSSHSNQALTGSLLGIPLTELSGLMKSSLQFQGSVVRVLVKEKEVPDKKRKKDDILGVGTAFVVHVGKDRVSFLTASHTFDDWYKKEFGKYIRLSNQREDHPLEIKFRDKHRDLCLFTVKAGDLPSNLKRMDFSTEQKAKGTQIVVLGYSHPTLTLPVPGRKEAIRRELVAVKKPTPLPGSLRVTPYVVRDKPHGLYYEELKYDVIAAAGHSGSPVIAEGMVIGVHLGAEGTQRDGVSNNTVRSTLRRWLRIGNDDGDNIERLFQRLDEQME